MAVTTTNLGVITAYGDAVAAGYTGTKAEWQTLMASYATVGQQAVDAKDDAVAAKDTAVSKATEATTAANTATTKANEASASAQSIAQSASQIAQNASDISELKEDLNDLENVTTEQKTIYVRQDLTWTSGYVAYNGATGASSIYIYSSKINVKTGDELRIVNTTNYANINTGIYLCAYNGNTPVPASGKSSSYNFPYTVPDGIDGVIVTIAAAYSANEPCAYIMRSDMLPIYKDEVENLKSVKNITIGDLTANTYINSTNGNTGSLNGVSCTDYISVEGNQKYVIHTDFISSAGGAFYDASKKYIIGIPANFGGEKDYDVISPHTARYIRFSVRGDITPTMKQYLSIGNVHDTVLDITEEYMDISMFDNMGVCGDSYTKAQFWNGNTVIGDNENISWGKIIERMKGINVTVYASSGANTENWQTRCLPSLLSDTPKRLYIFNLGINDSGTITLGTINDIHADYTENPNTFYGNWGRIIDQVKIHAPNAKLLLMKCWLVPSSYYDYSSDAIEEIAEHYNIPFLDTVNSSFLLSREYATKSGGHPTPIQQSGMAKAVCQLVAKCIQDNPDYFNDYYPQ